MKWYSYLLCFILIVLGVFSALGLNKILSAESYVKGSIDYTNNFIDDNFVYSSTSLVFYNDIYDESETYYFEIDLNRVKDFNGITNNYNITLNDYVLVEADINAGSIFAEVSMDFYDIDGNLIHNGILDISVRFLSGKTQLSVVTKTEKSASFFEQYFSDNGFRLFVTKIN